MNIDVVLIRAVRPLELNLHPLIRPTSVGPCDSNGEGFAGDVFDAIGFRVNIWPRVRRHALCPAGAWSAWSGPDGP